MLRARKLSVQYNKTKDADDNAGQRRARNVSLPDIGWVGPITLKKRAKPALKNERYRDISLRLSVQEVKNLSTKGKYFCEVCLDRILYACTTSKQATTDVFWGEKFELHNLPQISIITINLYRHGSAKPKRQRNKEVNHFVAFVTILLSDLPPATEFQQWLPMQSPHIAPHVVHLANQTPVVSTASTSQVPNATEELQSPAGGRFRKRTNPVTCFRHSTSAGAFPVSSELREDSGPPPEASRGFGKKKRSWTVGLGSLGDTALGSPILRNGCTKGDVTGCTNNTTSPCYNVSNTTSISPGENSMPQIRLTIQYETMDILPLNFYNDIRNFLKTHSQALIRVMEPNLTTKQKEELASCFVNIHEKVQELSAATFITELVLEDLQQNADASMFLRSNSIASKSVECYIKLVGAEYLRCVLKGSIDELLNSEDDFEIDPARLRSTETGCSEQNQLEKNRTALLKYTYQIWTRIVDCIGYVPYELREVFFSLRKRLEQTHSTETAYQIISSVLFLRFICPAIHGPVLFGLASSVPESPRVSRNLTLVAKLLQTVANQTMFGEKELHMRTLNSFVEREIPVMRTFLDHISSASLLEAEEQGPNYEDCHYFIDLGYEFAKLSELLSKYTENLSLPESLEQLPKLLNRIKERASDDVFTWCTPAGDPTDIQATGDEAVTHVQAVTTSQPPHNLDLRNTVPDEGTNSKVMTNGGSTPLLTKPAERIVEQPPWPNESGRVSEIERPNDHRRQPGVENSGDNMSDLLLRYRQQLHELNDCIKRVEMCTAQKALVVDDQHLASASSLSVVSNDTNGFSPLDVTQSSATREQANQNGNMSGTSNGKPHGHMDQQVQLLGTGDLSESSDYEIGDLRGLRDYTPVQGDGEIARFAVEEGATMKEARVSGSPSLDQLAERLQELKILLKQERQELVQVVARKTKAIQAQEQSIDQLASELDQLRRAPSTRFRIPPPPPTAAATTTPQASKYSSDTGSPSSSSFSSDYCLSQQYEQPNSVQPVDLPTPHCRHQRSASGFIHNYSHPSANGSRSGSFIARPDRSDYPKDKPHAQNAPNLVDLTRKMDGTGIPLEDLISTNTKQSIPVRRRFSHNHIFHK